MNEMGDVAVKKALILICILLLMLSFLPALAAVEEQTSAVKVKLVYKQTPIAGATLTLYQIGKAVWKDGNLSYAPISPYDSLGISFDNLTEHQKQSLSKRAVELIKRKGLSGSGTTSDAQGVALWSAVTNGVFLVCQTGSKGAANGYEVIEPIVIMLPVMNGGGTGWLETIEAYPKMKPTPTPVPTVTPGPDSDTVDLTVRKTWKDSNDADGVRPDSITLYLYCKPSTAEEYPTRPKMTVQMSGNGNRWKFTFSGLKRTDDRGRKLDYLVREGEVTGYLATYASDGFSITNVHATPSPDPQNTPTIEPPVTPEPTAPSTPKPNMPVGVIEIDGEWYYIDEYGIPLGIVPQTGDESDLILYAVGAFLLIGTASILGILLYSRRKEQKD